MTWYIQNRGEINMSKKKSYMNRKNILNEGFLTSFFKILTKGRSTKELDKALSNSRDFRRRVKTFNKKYDVFLTYRKIYPTKIRQEKVGKDKFLRKSFNENI